MPKVYLQLEMIPCVHSKSKEVLSENENPIRFAKKNNSFKSNPYKIDILCKVDNTILSILEKENYINDTYFKTSTTF